MVWFAVAVVTAAIWVVAFAAAKFIKALDGL